MITASVQVAEPVATGPIVEQPEVAGKSRFSQTDFIGVSAPLDASARLINQRNERLDHLANLGGMIIAICAVVSCASVAGWALSMLAAEVSQFSLADAVNALLGARIF